MVLVPVRCGPEGGCQLGGAVGHFREALGTIWDAMFIWQVCVYGNVVSVRRGAGKYGEPAGVSRGAGFSMRLSEKCGISQVRRRCVLGLVAAEHGDCDPQYSHARMKQLHARCERLTLRLPFTWSAQSNT